MNAKWKLGFVLTFFSGNLAAQNLTRYVNTLQGTNSTYKYSHGNTNAITALPFGMHVWSPQTGKNGDGWKYQYEKDSIRAFGQSHQCSPWMNDYAVFSLMPMPGHLAVNQYKRAARFSHANESARPERYAVKFDNGVLTEITPTERCAQFRFTFPSEKLNFVVLDGYTGASGVHIDRAGRTLTGYVRNGFGFPKEGKNYFVIRFDQPFMKAGTWENQHDSLQPGQLDAEGKGIGAWVGFRGKIITARVGSSYISPEQAVRNLDTEIGRDAFDQTRAKAGKIWNETLGRLLAEGGSEKQLTTFYSCLFRASLYSRMFYEMDSTGKPYYFSPYDSKAHTGYMYTDNGFWDTFRSEFPLHNILYRTIQQRYMPTLIDAYHQGGWLPSWSFPSETGVMVGNHAISILTDAWVKGIHSFDPDSALAAYLHEATNKGDHGGANGRAGWQAYFTLGYVPYPNQEGATGATLEYAYDDFCAWQLARVTGNKFYERIFERQLFNYRNVYDSATGFLRGRAADGTFNPNFDPIEWGGPYTEGNAWHYAFGVFHDQAGLIRLMGGDEKYAGKLDALFAAKNDVKFGTYGGMIHEMTEMAGINMGQLAVGNQPAQHVPYLYDYCRQPWKTQYWVRRVLDSVFRGDENGFPGDEDQGQTASWYVLGAMSLYATCPGTDQYVIGSPLFPKLTLTLENGKKFIIEASGNKAGTPYIRSATINGQQYTKNFITMENILAGGVLHFEMSAVADTVRGTGEADRPYSVSSKN